MTTQCLSAQQEEQQLHILDSWHCSAGSAGLWPPSRSEDHPKMDHVPKGLQTKVSRTLAWGSQAMGRRTREGTRDKHALLCALCICWQAGPSWNSSLSKLCQRQLEWVACLTWPRRKQGRKETRLTFDPERGTIWHSGVASFFFSFSFFFFKENYRCMITRTTGHILMKHCSAAQSSQFCEFGFNVQKRCRVHRSSTERVQQGLCGLSLR